MENPEFIPQFSGFTVTSLYQQLRQALSAELDRGTWKPGEQIPSEAQLSQIYGVSRITVRAAVEALAEEGALLRIQGKGTFVTHLRKKKLMMADGLSFTEFCRQNHFTPSRRLLCCQMEPAGEQDREDLALEEGEQVLRLDRLLLADALPMMISCERYLPEYAFLLDADLEKNSLLALVREHIPGGQVSSLRRTVECSVAGPEDAGLLDIPKGSPLLLLRDVMGDGSGRAIRRSRELLAGDKICFSVGGFRMPSE
ncbi:MAG: GntR family transcriptional regulator [Oscillospiraceae bacterium]|nr:GntR family transcriptional regulator [Oscillospiraceae bacterium]